MYDRLPTPFGLVRGGVAPGPPEDQVGHPGLRQDRRPPRVPLLRQRGDGARPHPRRPVGLLPRDHLRGRRAHRPAHGDPARAPARQPLGHRVRGLVQRPPRLPPPRLRPVGRAARRWSATATWRWTWRASSRARARCWRPPTSPSTRSTSLGESGIREIHVLGRRGPAQAAFTNKELKELGELPGRRRDRRPGRPSSSTRSRQAYVAPRAQPHPRSQPGAPARVTPRGR